MTVFTGIILYILIWWTALFAVLPLGVRMSADLPPQEGIQAAPQKPQMKRKFIITTLVAALLWLIVYMLIKIDIIDFRALAKALSAQDR